MIDVLRIGFEKEDFQKMTAEERGLLLLLGYSSNQVNVLWKLVIEATNRTPSDPVDSRVSGAQTQIVARLLIGALWEAWRLVEGRLLKSKLGKDVVPLLDQPALKALEQLKKRFGASGMIAAVRNDYAYHYPENEQIEAAFQAAARSEDGPENWSLYVSHALLNCFFFASDFVFSHGITHAVGETDVNEGHKKLLMELGPIANELSELTFGYAAAMFKKYVGNEMVMTVVAKIEAPTIDGVVIPFFVDTDTSKAMKQ